MNSSICQCTESAKCIERRITQYDERLKVSLLLGWLQPRMWPPCFELGFMPWPVLCRYPHLHPRPPQLWPGVDIHRYPTASAPNGDPGEALSNRSPCDEARTLWGGWPHESTGWNTTGRRVFTSPAGDGFATSDILCPSPRRSGVHVSPLRTCSSPVGGDRCQCGRAPVTCHGCRAGACPAAGSSGAVSLASLGTPRGCEPPAVGHIW
jgi:hypothetical protein